MSATVAPVNTMSYEAKPLMLDVIRTERSRFYDIIDDPKNWEVQTRCEAWEVRDIVGHMIDVTEGYLDRWQMAREGRGDTEIAEAAAQRVYAWVGQMSLPQRLRDASVQENTLAHLAELAAQNRTVQNNPVPVNAAQLAELLHRMW